MRVRRVLGTVVLASVLIIATSGCNALMPSVCSLFGRVWFDDLNECDLSLKRSAAASPGEVLFISATAHQAGAQGTNWRSDLEIHNLADELGVFEVLLLEHGADPGAEDNLGRTAAARAEQQGQQAIVEMLARSLSESPLDSSADE